MKLVILSLTLLLPLVTFGESSVIKGRPLKYAANNDFENRLDEQEQKIRRLIGKIEVLERKVDIVTKNANITLDSENTEIMIENSNAPDVFDVSLLKDIPSPAVETKPVVVPSKNITPDKQAYDLALAAYKDNKLTEAKDKFKNFIKNYPKNAMISNAYFWYGECFFKQKDYNSAAVNYLKSYKEAPKGPKSSDGLLKLALSLGELKKTQEACIMLVKLDKEFPSNRTVASKKMAEDAKIKFGCKTKQSK